MGGESGLKDQLVPNRDCGGCTVCCKDLAINEPDLKKVRGVLCEHCAKDSGCAIYETRPGICRTWFCGWRLLPQLDDGWRPDKSPAARLGSLSATITTCASGIF